MVLQFLMAFFIVPVDLFRLNVRSSRVRQMQQLSFGLLQSHTTESSLVLFQTPVFMLFKCTVRCMVFNPSIAIYFSPAPQTCQ